MKAESAKKPTRSSVDRVGDIANISLCDNINKTTKIVEDNEIKVFEYDYYLLKVPYREDLKKDVEDNFDAWLSTAIQKELNKHIKPPEIEDRVEMLEDTINFLLGL